MSWLRCDSVESMGEHQLNVRLEIKVLSQARWPLVDALIRSVRHNSVADCRIQGSIGVIAETARAAAWSVRG